MRDSWASEESGRRSRRLLDTGSGWGGLPAEPFGFSNHPRVFLGMPAWNAVRLAVPKTDLRTAVKLHNP